MTLTDARYQRARRLAVAGELSAAADAYYQLQQDEASGSAMAALIANDLGALEAAAGRTDVARDQFLRALDCDPGCTPARDNLTSLGETAPAAPAPPSRGTRVAIVSFLFNWPSTGGGIIHTVELTRFLAAAGYDTRLICPAYTPWSIGAVDDSCPVPVDVLDFTPGQWTVPAIEQRFREAVDAFEPDAVIITDSWNFKPHLAHALAGYRVFLRLQAQECLCPLNNLRLRPADTECDAGSVPGQCHRHQLALPGECRSCLVRHGDSSGRLHQWERTLSGVGSDVYDQRLRDAFRNAACVLALNPLVAETVRPWCDRVEVVTWGLDPARFPWPATEDVPPDSPFRLLFAGVPGEAIKGFSVLRAAGEWLWRQRQDFEVVITAAAPADPRPWERFIGWQSQADLPAWYRRTHATVVPTIAQDGLSRTSVEAMASGRPVIGSRLGGVPSTVIDGLTGLLVPPGDAAALAAAIARLADDGPVRTELGRNGRRRFEAEFPWPRVIAESYAPLLGPPVRIAHREAP